MAIDIKLQLKLLKELQAIDMHVRQFEEELSSIPALMEEAKSDWLESSNSLREKEEEKAVSEKERRSLEQELEDSKARLVERENKLYAIKTNKEYQAALKEIADGKRANSQREDAILRHMEKIEQISGEITQLSRHVAEKEIEFRKEEAELKQKEKELAKEVEARAVELKKIEKEVDKSALEKYNSIRTRYADPLADVVGGICQGCNMNVPPQMFIELLKGLKFHFCPSCYRFICAAEKVEESQEENET